VGQRGVYRSTAEGGANKVTHGLFKTAGGKVINADVNGAYNILRKAFPEALAADGIEGRGLVPVAVRFSKQTQDFTGLKQLAANLNSSTDTLPKASSADGSEAPGQRQGGSSDSTKNLGKTRTEQSLLNFVNKV
jgi:hypothetical protein